MGKKATLIYFRFLGVLLTTALAIFTVVLGRYSYQNPSNGFLFPIIGLGMIPALLANFALAIYWGIRWKKWIWIPVIAIAANYEYISATYQIPHKLPNYADKGNSIRIASLNVQSFHGDPSVYSVGEITGLMKEQRIDVVCLQEFAESPYYSSDNINAQFKEYPYVAMHKKNTPGFGLVIYSKFPITNRDDLFFGNSDNSAMWVDIKVGQTPLRVFNCHLQTTNFNQTKGLLKIITLGEFYDTEKEAAKKITDKLFENALKRSNQVDLLRHIIDTTKHSIIACGDFNAPPSSYSYHRMKEKLQDGFQSAGSGFGYTYRYLHKTLRIDYVFHSNELTGIEYSSPSFDFSDHNPVIMELAIKKEK